MKLHHLRYFLVLAEELHFGRAATRLAITQPPLSGAIKAMEYELGALLFERDSKRVSLTATGAAFRAEAQHILERLERAADVARAVAGGKRGRIHVGFTGSMVYRELPAIMLHFNRAEPDVEVVLRELSTAPQLEEIVRGELDAGFVNVSTVPHGLRGLPLVTDHFVCCLPANHRLGRRRSLRLQELAQERFVMFARDVAPANHDNVLAVFSRAGVQPQLVHAARQWLTVIAMVAHGLGVALVPSSLAASRVADVVFIPLAHLPSPSAASLVWRAEDSNVALQRFLDVAREVLAQSSLGR